MMGTELGKLLIFVGLLFVIVGVLLLVGTRLGFGRLPGDIVIERDNFVFYFPLATSVLLSLLLTALLWIMQRFSGRP